MDLPHSEKDEAELLGACLKSKNIQKTVIQEIPLDAIFIRENYYILKAIKELNAIGKFADLHTTWDYIEEKKYPVEYECLLAVSYHGDYIDLNYYIEHILSLSNKRKLADLSKTLAADVFTKESANVLIQKYTQKLAQLATGKAGSFESAYNILDKFTPTNTWEQEIRDRVIKHRSGQTVFDGFRTGFPSLDNLIGGFGNGKSTIIGARSGSGKTTLVVNLMLLNKELYPNSKLGFFSLEMSARDIMEKTAAAYMQVAYQKIAEGNLSDDEVLKADVTADFLRKSGFYFYDRPNLTVSNAYNVLRRAILEYDLQMVFIDYMTIMKPDRVTGNIYVDTDVISKAVQSMSREFNIPFVTLAQLSRKSADRSDGTPQLTDLRNSGCLAADTIIRDIQGRTYTIKQLADSDAQITVFAMDKDLRIKPFEMTRVFKSGIKKTYTLTTKSGRRIRASANHPFYTINGWKPLSDLTLREHIAVPRELNFQGDEDINDDELVLLAHLLGDGCILPNQPYHYTSADDVNMQAVRDAAKRLFDIDSKTVAQGNRSHVYLRCPYHLTHRVKHPITKWFESLGIDRVRSYEKKIPEKFFALSNEKLALFMKHLWATDGGLSTKKLKGRKDSVSIYYSTNSSALAHQVQHLLLRFGILSKITSVTKGQYKPNYHVNVYGAEMQLKFLRKIGCYGKRGDKIEKYIHDLNQIKQNPNNDIIPKQIWSYIREKNTLTVRRFARNLGIVPNGSALYNNGISRSRMSRIVSFMPDENLVNLAESSIYWDEVLSIEECGEELVYDATVPGAHNFVANDIIVHNSIEEDSDTVIMIHRPPLINGQASNRSQLHVVKNRHRGDLGRIELTYDHGRLYEAAPIEDELNRIFGGDDE